MKAMRKVNPQCPQLQNRPSQMNTIIQTEAEHEHDAAQGGHTSLINNLAPVLLNVVAKCAYRIALLEP